MRVWKPPRVRSALHFFIDFGRDKACNLHVVQRPLTKGVLFAPSDTGVTGDVRKFRSRPSATNRKRGGEVPMKFVQVLVCVAAVSLLWSCASSSNSPQSGSSSKLSWQESERA